LAEEVTIAASTAMPQSDLGAYDALHDNQS
jgi:hypothetical protein